MTKQRPWYLYALTFVAVALAVLAIAQIGPPTSSARTSTQIVTAENGIVQSTVTGTGNIAAGADLDVNFQTSGTLSSVNVTQGQHVNKGQLLGTLDSTSAQLTLDQADQNLTAAEDQLSTAESSASSTTSSTTTTASLNSGAGSGSSQFVSDTTNVPTTTTAKPTSTTSTTTTTPQTTTTTKPATTAPTTTSAPTTSAATSSGGGGSAGSSSGGSGSGGSGSTGTSSTSPAGAVASAQAAVYSAEASVSTAKTALANTKLYAPISGTIVSLANLSPGDSVSAGSTSSASASGTSSSGTSSTSSTGGGGTGATTAGSLGGSSSSSSSTAGSSTSPFAEIVNTNTMTMPVALSESDISKVKVGQPATVTLDALTGVQLAAHVSAISTVGTTSSGVVSYNATLTLDQSNSQVKPGMSASASIIVAQAQGVNVPNSAITGTGSIATVTLDSNGKKTQQQVAIGLRGTTRTQIVSGLSAGQQLAVTTVLPALTSGTSTTSSSGSGTLGGTTVRPGGFGGGGGFPGGAGGAGGARGGAGAGGAGATPAG